MKRVPSCVQRLALCGLALAMTTSLLAQSMDQGTAKVVRIGGNARYTTGNNVWQPLRVGASLKPGTIIQTAGDKSFVDLVLGDGSAGTVARAPLGMPSSRSYSPTSTEQNIVRLYENSVLQIDKLNSTTTGADTVSEIGLDLQRGKLFGNVKKMSAASKYEVKLPNGMAGIRGTIYTLTADGTVRVLVGSVVIAYVGPDGNVVTQVVMGGQQFDAKTGQITPIPNFDQQEMVKLAKESRLGPNTPPTTFTVDHTIYYVSPTIGHNGNAGGNGPPPGGG